MEAMREKWTDERLDDMSARMVEGFNRLDAELRDSRTGIRGEFMVVRAEMNSRFDATQRLILQVGGGMFATMVVGFIGLLVSQH
jgi:hypothetical protein